MAEAPKPATQPKPPIAVEDKSKFLALQPRNFEELWRFASMICETDFVPPALRMKPGAVIACVQFGSEVGLPPMTSLQGIAVINGRPSIWGETYNMLLQSHPELEWMKELGPDEALKAKMGECTIKRRGREPITRRYTVEMAERAGLWGGKGDTEEKRRKSPWWTVPGRMLQMRARHLCGVDALPEATGPLAMREEAEDYTTGAIETTATPAAPQEEPLKEPQAVPEKDPHTPYESKAGQVRAGDREEPHGPSGAEVEAGSPENPESGGRAGKRGLEKEQPPSGPPESVPTSVETPTGDAGQPGETKPTGEGDRPPDDGGKVETAAKPGAQDQPPGAGKPPKKERAKKEKDPPPVLDRKVAILDWLEGKATRDEILDNTNFLTVNLHYLNATDQMEVCRVWNVKRKEAHADKQELS